MRRLGYLLRRRPMRRAVYPFRRRPMRRATYPLRCRPMRRLGYPLRRLPLLRPKLKRRPHRSLARAHSVRLIRTPAKLRQLSAAVPPQSCPAFCSTELSAPPTVPVPSPRVGHYQKKTPRRV